MKRILLVDDDETFRPLLAGLLRNEFEVVETSGVKDALKMLASIPVDLICSDYNMRDGTGIDLLQSCRQKHFSIPFILMSANDGNSLSRKADLYGISFCKKSDPDFRPLIRKMLLPENYGKNSTNAY